MTERFTRRRRAGARRTGTQGYTMLEMLVTMTLLVSLMAVIGPNVVQHLSKGDSAALAQSLDALSRGLNAFRGDVGRYPQRLNFLVDTLTASATDVCSTPSVPRTFPEPARRAWRGPYVARLIPSTGLVLGSMTVQNTLRRDPMQSTGSGVLLIDVHGVEKPVAEVLERTYDGPPGTGYGLSFGTGSNPSNTGAVLFNDSMGVSVGRLSFKIPLMGC